MPVATPNVSPNQQFTMPTLDIDGMDIRELKAFITQRDLSHEDCREKRDLVARAHEALSHASSPVQWRRQENSTGQNTYVNRVDGHRMCLTPPGYSSPPKNLRSCTAAELKAILKRELRIDEIGDVTDSDVLRDMILSARQGLEDSECAICLDSLANALGKGPFSGLHTTPCGHQFHSKCIMESIRVGNENCPLCRARTMFSPTPASSRNQTRAAPAPASSRNQTRAAPAPSVTSRAQQQTRVSSQFGVGNSVRTSSTSRSTSSSGRNCIGCRECPGCANCTYCGDCANCANCTNSADCSRCRNCTNCTDCQFCGNCTGCKDCQACTNCTGCKDCEGCTNCTNCTNVQGLRNATNVHG